MKFLPFLIILFSTFNSFAQPANDDCSNAVTLTNLNGGCVTVNNTGATFDNYTLTCQGESNNIWFSFVAQGGYATVNVSGVSSPDVAISYAPTGSPCNIADAVGVACNTGANNGSSVNLTSNDLIPGNTYYIQVTNNTGGSGGPGPVTVCVTNPVGPANDLCSAAEPITTLDGSCTGGTTLGATSDSYEPSCWGSSLYDESHTVWYSFVAQGYEATIDITGEAASYPGVAIFSTTSGGDICNIGDAIQWDCSSWANGTYSSSSAQVTGYPLTIGDTYYVAVTMEDEDDGTFQICIDNPANPIGDNCFSAAPFCTGTTETFPANTDEAIVDQAEFDCLLSQANPAWYYLEIATAGDIEITMTNSNSEDIDFILWGPFSDVPNGCAPGIDNTTAVEDCSYSTAATEIATVTGGVVGETYIMLITNFSNDPTDITFSQTGGTGTTDCAIVLPVEMVNFKATPVGQTDIINWKTVSEKNNDYFTLEYSIDGLNWEIIDIVVGQEASSQEINYSSINRNPVGLVGLYRIKQTDFNGKESSYEYTSVSRSENANLLYTVNLLGQKVDSSFEGMVIDVYENGATIKRYQK